MSIKENNFHHSISPDKVIRGNQAWKEGKKLIPHYCKSPLLLGRSKTTKKIRKVIKNDLQLLGIKPGELVKVKTRRGEIELAVRIDPALQDNLIFIPFCFNEASANLLTNSALDPFGKIPELKFCAAQIKC